MHTANLSTAVEYQSGHPNLQKSGNGSPSQIPHFCPTLHIRNLLILIVKQLAIIPLYIHTKWKLKCAYVCRYIHGTKRVCEGNKEYSSTWKVRTNTMSSKVRKQLMCAAKQWDKVPLIVRDKFHTLSQSDHWLKKHVAESMMHMYVCVYVLCAPVLVVLLLLRQ